MKVDRFAHVLRIYNSFVGNICKIFDYSVFNFSHIEFCAVRTTTRLHSCIEILVILFACTAGSSCTGLGSTTTLQLLPLLICIIIKSVLSNGRY